MKFPIPMPDCSCIPMPALTPTYTYATLIHHHHHRTIILLRVWYRLEVLHDLLCLPNELFQTLYLLAGTQQMWWNMCQITFWHMLVFISIYVLVLVPSLERWHKTLSGLHIPLAPGINWILNKCHCEFCINAAQLKCNFAIGFFNPNAWFV